MTAFLISLAVLVAGYVLYGLLTERIFGIDKNRETPAYSQRDGIDYIPMPTWKVFLIQFLNIAGLGPIFGAIMGVMYGPASFIWIVAGTIFGGAVHDYVSAMMSLRSGGLSLPELVGDQLGLGIKQLMRVFSVLLMILVGSVFVFTPADIIAGMTPESLDRTFWIVVIFAYYILATLMPIDKIIGRFYPIFGVALLFMAVALLVILLVGGHDIPVGFEDGLASRYGDDAHPVFPMMFVSIACGAISGFHGTQSPMMARCLKNERLARPVFYGAMVAEGLVALIWAAATIAFTGGYGELKAFFADGGTPGALVHNISMTWLGGLGGVLALLGVVAAPITTGDTALRSARLIAADMLKVSQKTLVRRLAVSIPLFGLAFVVMMIDFNVLWRYFAWCNQTLAMFTLWAASVYLARHHKAYIITLIPALFMTMTCLTYLLFARSPEGLGLDYNVAFIVAGCVSAACLTLFVRYVVRLNTGVIKDEVRY